MDNPPQFSLFSTISKYNIDITQSRYRLCFFYTIFIAVLIVFSANFFIFTRADTYLMILTLLAISIFSIGVINSVKGKERVLRSFTLANDGVISFSDERLNYQLLASSRFSFFGCWLIMKLAITNGDGAGEVQNVNFKTKRCFIYRDSLNGQDFARLIKVLASLR